MYGPGTLDRMQKRRAIYFMVKRSQLIPMMTQFDAPDSLVGIEARPTTTVAPQALLLMNNALVRDCATHLAERVRPKAETPLADAVRSGYALALGRAPTEQEAADAVRFIEEQADGVPEGRQGGRGSAGADGLLPGADGVERVYLCGLEGRDGE